MKNLIRFLLPQVFINNFWHLPKAVLANIFYGFHTKKLTVIGVTGTDGKTTTTNMIYQILKAAGKKVSMVSTVNAVIAGKTYDLGFHVSSPDPFTIQNFARGALNNHDQYLVLETTSHALDQYRFWGINFDIAVITNITGDHLDYHKTFENYLKTKLKILKNSKNAVVNYNLLDKVPKNEKIISFGLLNGDLNQKSVRLNLKMPGEFNIENALAALSLAFLLKIDKQIARKTLENFEGLIGRMQEIKNNKGIKVVIDFASTANSLENSLKALRKLTRGRLIAVFGSAGKRDVEKRFLMGEVSAKLANITVITAEDPRGELEKISQQIAQGAIKGGAKEDINLFLVGDRTQAIDFAINKLAKRGDTVGIFGKGHERSMNLDGKKELPWSEFEAVEKALL